MMATVTSNIKETLIYSLIGLVISVIMILTVHTDELPSNSQEEVAFGIECEETPQ